MSFKFDFKKMISFLKKEKTLLFFVIILAYLIRVLPYLLGYPIPITEDGIRDFQQVKYIIDNNRIDFFASYQNFGQFPILHLLIVGISKLGFDPMKVFLFIPQIFASLGILFYYLFLKKYFSVRQSLLACFLIAFFIPHIYWTAQPVRETIGLFFFPLIIYLFDKEATGHHSGIINKLWLFLSFLLMPPTHHWSSVMLVCWLVFYSIFFIKRKKQLLYAFTLIAIFVSFNIIYWSYFFSFAFVLIGIFLKRLSVIYITLIILFVGIFNIFRRIDIDRIKTKGNRRTIALVIIGMFLLIALKMSPLVYPLQIWLEFVLYLLFIFIGFFYTKNKNLNNLTIVGIFYSFFVLIALSDKIFKNINLNAMSFDPFRTFEFAIFPLSIAGSFGLLFINDKIKYFLPVACIILLALSTFAYPPIFIYKNNFIDTPFYDIRSDIKYISSDTRDLIKWANDHNLNVESNRPEIISFQATFYPVYEQKITLTTPADEVIKKKYDYIHDPIMKIGVYKDTVANTFGIVYKNNGGILTEKLYKAEFIKQKIPNPLIFKVGQKISFSFTMKNVGSKTWLLEDDYKLMDHSYDISLKLPYWVLPGQTVDFFINNFIVSELPGHYQLSLQMFNRNVGWFGELIPPLNVVITK